MNLPELTSELLRLSRLLDAGIEALQEHARGYAEAENAYRKARARAWLEITDGPVAQREAQVDGATADDRMRRDISDGMKRAATEAVRSRRQQISALQSLAAAHRAEAEFSKFGPEAA